MIQGTEYSRNFLFCRYVTKHYTSRHSLPDRKALWVGYRRPCPAEQTVTQGLEDLCHSLVLE